MDRIEKTVFISYRRNDESWGLAVFQDLTQHGYDVFIDYDGIASGKFEAIILENIRARVHFLVLLTPTALDRCSHPKDWMRREIEAALDHQRNIVPLMLAGFDFDTPAAARQLTGKLAALKDYNGLRIPKGFFSPAMERLRSKFLNVPVDSVLHQASTSAQQAAKEQKDKAAMAPQAILGAATMGGNDSQGENSKDKKRALWPLVAAVTVTLFAITAGLATLTDAVSKIWNTTKLLIVSAPITPTAVCMGSSPNGQGEEIIREYADFLQSHVSKLRYTWQGGSVERGVVPDNGVPVRDVVPGENALTIRYEWQDGRLVLRPATTAYGSAPFIKFQGYWEQHNGSGCVTLMFPLIEKGRVVGSNTGENFARGYWTGKVELVSDASWSSTLICKDCSNEATPPPVTQVASPGTPQDSIAQEPSTLPTSPASASPESSGGRTVISDSDILARALRLSPREAAAQCDPKSDTETRLIGCTAIILRGKNPEVTLADALDTRCWAYNDLGQFQRASEDCKASIGKSPSSAYPYNNLGTSYLGLGDGPKAITAFTRSIELKPTFLFAYLGRAKAYAAMSNAELAKKDFQHALSLDPTNQEAKNGLAALNIP